MNLDNTLINDWPVFFHHMSPTFLKPNDNLNIRGYTMYNHIHQLCDKASGGSSIVVNNSIPRAKFI